LAFVWPESRYCAVNAGSVEYKVLREGKTVYLVYFKTKGQNIRKDVQFWSRTVQKTQQGGHPVFAVTQEWEYKDTIL